MSILLCSVKGFSSTVSEISLPIEIRTMNYTLVEKGITDKEIEVPPGIYIIIISLPAGQRLISRPTQVNADPKRPTKVILTVGPEDRSPNESLEEEHFFSKVIPTSKRSRNGWSLFAFLRQYGEGIRNLDSLRLEARVFSGNGLAKKFEPADVEAGLQPTTAGGFFEIDFRDVKQSSKRQQILTLQVRQKHSSRYRNSYLALNMRLPIFVGESHYHYTEVDTCKIFLIAPDYSPDVHLKHLQANALMHYLSRGQLEQADTLIRSLGDREYDLNKESSQDRTLTAESLLKRKTADPFAAAVGAYTLLRLGELDRLHDWTENLMNWFPWLPDGLIIRAEHLAREGDYQRANNLLYQLPERGLPIFTIGLTMALDRLRSFSRKNSTANETRLIEVLSSYVKVSDLSKPLLTFSGDDPTVARIVL